MVNVATEDKWNIFDVKYMKFVFGNGRKQSGKLC